jgi:hypothetical protein
MNTCFENSLIEATSNETFAMAPKPATKSSANPTQFKGMRANAVALPLIIQFAAVMLAFRFPDQIMAFFRDCSLAFHAEVASNSIVSAQHILTALASAQ